MLKTLSCRSDQDSKRKNWRKQEQTASDKADAIKQGRVFHPLCSLAHNIHHKGTVSRFTIASGRMRAGMLEVLCCSRETALAGLCALPWWLELFIPEPLHLLLVPYQSPASH